MFGGGARRRTGAGGLVKPQRCGGLLLSPGAQRLALVFRLGRFRIDTVKTMRGRRVWQATAVYGGSGKRGCTGARV